MNALKEKKLPPFADTDTTVELDFTHSMIASTQSGCHISVISFIQADTTNSSNKA
ncbi:hypothetical protein [Moraxella lacunata]|uniref:hypothetical protein n=1 Tax=Moraxella lacunata TaxID=477 RepID=UPI003EE176A4